ncbi:RpiR family transcriptional regulator [Pararhizobium sp. YC-54]|uniref:RpiR family transcriptional regulator n=1 Tax=Pararhizobium sp. YC-54 TaxID=2986920 RepID=UPI0021F756FB|nr:RpiR family transcriptional regulator [Pararhizobium sp. YC-54]MCW0001388.1 RpiR family transcriptional regulator [Pararhizobium sp. YC-54]
MRKHVCALNCPPSSFDELKQAISSRQVIFPLRVENVAKRVLERPEFMAFESTASIVEDCGVSAATVARFVTHIGFRDVAQARGIFRAELCRRFG